MNIHDLISNMTLQEKVGQLFMLAFAGNQLDYAQEMLVSNLVGACYISQDNAETPQQAWNLANNLQNFAAMTPKKIPLILGADQEGAWGVLVPYSCTGPGNLELGAADNPEITKKMYQVIGQELNAVGYNTLLAPCVDVNSNPENVILGSRSFGAFQSKVAVHAGAAVIGAREGNVITTAKHYPGHGDTRQDSHRMLPTVNRSLEELESIDLIPFQAAIDVGVDIIMTAHILYPKIDPVFPATMSRVLLTDILRTKMGFKGVILSDSMNMFAIRKNYAPDEAAILAILAGVDLIMLAEEHYDHSQQYIEKQLVTVNGVINAVNSGRIPVSRLDDAVLHVLSLKYERGLFDRKPIPEGYDLVGTLANRGIEAYAAESGIVLVKDERNLLKKIKSTRIAVVRTTPLNSYTILANTRGIGPNQNIPAYDDFIKELTRLIPSTSFLTYEDCYSIDDLPEVLSDVDVIIGVTEDYPLPGVDFEKKEQHILVRDLIEMFSQKLIVVGLCPPYEINYFEGVQTYISACSSRSCAAIASAKALAGIIECKGTLPVQIE